MSKKKNIIIKIDPGVDFDTALVRWWWHLLKRIPSLEEPSSRRISLIF